MKSRVPAAVVTIVALVGLTAIVLLASAEIDWTIEQETVRPLSEAAEAAQEADCQTGDCSTPEWATWKLEDHIGIKTPKGPEFGEDPPTWNGLVVDDSLEPNKISLEEFYHLNNQPGTWISLDPSRSVSLPECGEFDTKVQTVVCADGEWGLLWEFKYAVSE